MPPEYSFGCRIASCLQCDRFRSAIRVYIAPTSPCSGCSLSWCSHLPPSREFFTRVCAFHPYDDGLLQASASPPSGFICVGSTRPTFLKRSCIPLSLYLAVKEVIRLQPVNKRHSCQCFFFIISWHSSTSDDIHEN